jgi:signal transduction histidine kinase
MLFGPFADTKDAYDERDFLFEINRIVGWSVYSQLQSLRLRNEKERLIATTQLLQHRFRTALTPITTHVGRAKLQLDRRQYDAAIRPVTEQIKAAKEICLQVGKSAGETARSAVVMVEHDDLKFDLYPLSVLVANCAEGFVQRAMERGRELLIEPTIESLPYAEVDIARLTIAISNLLDNAVKYSYPSTKIYVRTGVLSTLDQHHSTVSIHNLGDAIPPDKMHKIFERGERGLVEAKMGKIEGTGYGLWEARAIVEAHRGTITVSCEESNFHSRQGRGYHVTFTLRLPLRQNAGH